MKTRKWLLSVLALLVLAVGIRIWWINTTGFQFPVEICEMGEWVPLEGDFFYSSAENTDGYSVRLESAEVLSYEEFMARFDTDTEYLGVQSRFDVILLQVGFQNEDNIDGGVFIRDMNLLNGTLSAYYNRDDLYMEIANEKVGASEGISVQPGTEASMYMVYTTIARADNVTFLDQHAGESDVPMYLNVSQYPAKKLIRFTIDCSGIGG